eukprot:CAMPEP_0183727112 /NCGR_PEP_ID=MMETSP0737-20130205/24908_1 /TAXON_ID=385413 /ORGANISM="Thalassiosira miniscula, Strain CCMP1093" /LENGTH=221 /DNA_ID=CAMNT_0025958663 /DNA_START=25 /DNA_END=690 /DNA_ORIENTATION=-
MTKANTKANTAKANTAAGEYLLERLRILLQRLQSTTEILQNWPETQGDSAKVHADTAAKLIASIRKIVLGLRSVERHVNGTGPSNQGGAGGTESAISKEALEAFRTSLEDKCPIPLDLLDLLDVGQPFGLNPQCYARGLMKESIKQLAGFERRKCALAMLAQSIEKGMDVDARTTKGGAGDVSNSIAQKGEDDKKESSNKRKSDSLGESSENVKKMQRTES